MKKYLLIAAILMALFGGVVWAVFLNENAFENCILENMPGARSDTIANLIINVCRDITAAKLQVSNEQRNYDQCILNNLTGAETDLAIKQVMDACERLHKH